MRSSPTLTLVIVSSSPLFAILVAVLCLALEGSVAAIPSATLQGRIVDADTGELLPARLTIQNEESGSWHHARSISPEGKAVPYDVRRTIASTEVHTSLSAHPFAAGLPPGSYTLTAERRKEYLPASAQVTIAENIENPEEVTLSLKRWSDLAAQGWYSGETHTHRRVADLPTLMLAEDLNVTLPLTAWVTDSRQTPATANKNPEPVPPAKLITVDPSHVVWPVNTEYEIFTVNGKQHTLGAVFVLNHQEALELSVPPVGPIATEARRQGALLDLDKHNWPWSMMLMPIMKVNLFELTNNPLWKRRFLFRDWYSEYVHNLPIEMTEDGLFAERGWIDFGFLNYYALINCGYDMKPSAGTASGVHPVPLGFGRVYVKVSGPFTYQKWIDGLKAGHSFVTTGPMLLTEQSRKEDRVQLTGTFSAGQALGPIEIIVNGEVTQTIAPPEDLEPSNAQLGQRFTFEATIALKSSSWIAVRGFEDRPDGRPRFAHTAPVHHRVEGRPLLPRATEVAYLRQRVADELERHQDVLPEEALREYQIALETFDALPQRFRKIGG